MKSVRAKKKLGQHFLKDLNRYNHTGLQVGFGITQGILWHIIFKAGHLRSMELLSILQLN